jgi:hypothetical protein
LRAAAEWNVEKQASQSGEEKNKPVRVEMGENKPVRVERREISQSEWKGGKYASHVQSPDTAYPISGLKF